MQDGGITQNQGHSLLMYCTNNIVKLFVKGSLLQLNLNIFKGILTLTISLKFERIRKLNKLVL